MKTILCLTMLLIVGSLAAGQAAIQTPPATVQAPQATVQAPPASVQSADETAAVTLESMGFGTERVFKGPNWQVEKYQDATGRWRARLTSNNAVVTDLGDCGNQSDWMRLVTWPLDNNHPGKILGVLRYEGGANGADALDLYLIDENLRTILDVEGDFNFRGIREISGDDWPEVIGVSRSFANMMLLDRDRSPYPLMVLGYHPESRQYVCLNHHYQDALRARSSDARDQFEANPASRTPIVYSQTDTRQRDVFAQLLRWVVTLAYMGQENEAWGYLDQHTDGSTYDWTKREIENRLAADRYYQQMIRLRTTQPPATALP